jgi:hypothetical protein
MWYAAQLKPHLFNAFLLAGLPPAGQDLSARWKQIAADSLAMLSDSEVRCGVEERWLCCRPCP